MCVSLIQVQSSRPVSLQRNATRLCTKQEIVGRRERQRKKAKARVGQLLRERRLTGQASVQAAGYFSPSLWLLHRSCWCLVMTYLKNS